ncbi:hypothetical protein H4R99_001840 [Coemansia sp. RSA 1722]|nr:hypothetical protein LPJ57_001816 [Coemansia sp. RSA 486]KAJ2224979.1 hypothetical protein IWW45_007973 [Coemansia sp. RSA 485]KAJ2604411.1 hypothetical protein H4R99_001840 [Coemansia sp. RSA 1722]
MSDSGEKILLNWVPGTHNYHVRASVMLALSIVYTLFIIVSTVLFVIVARNKRSGLEKRSVKLVIFQAFGCYLAGVNGLVTAALNNWACFGKLWLFNLGFLISLSAMSARAFHLMVVYTVHELTSELNSRNPIATQSVNSHDPQPSKASRQQGYLSGFRISGLADVLSESVPRLRQARKLDKYKKLLPFITERMLFMYMAVFVFAGIILTLVINITDKQFAMRPVHTVCVFYWGFLPVTAIVVLFFFIVFPVVLWRVWRNNDAYGIRNDLIICDTVGIFCMVITLIWVNALKETQQIWPGMSFVWVYALFIHVTSVFIPLITSFRHMRQSEDQEKKQENQEFGFSSALPMSSNLSRRAAFNRMLDNTIDYQSFRIFAASCFCSELTGFIEEYQILKARTVLLIKNKGASSGLSEIIPATPDSIEKHKDKITVHAGKDATIDRFRLSQCMVDDALAVCIDSVVKNTTGFNVSIVDTVLLDKENDSEYKPTSETEDSEMQFPELLFERIARIYSEYIDPSSFSSVNASASVVKRITERLESREYPLDLFDDLKREVMFMLYSDVYSRYIRK